MNVFYILCGVIALLSALVFSAKSVKSTARRAAMLFYAVAFAGYMFIINSIVSPLCNLYAADSTYVSIFMTLITIIAVIPFITLAVLAFVNKDNIKNTVFNVILVAEPLIFIAFAVSCFFNSQKFMFLLAFILPHMLLPLVESASSLEDFSKRSEFIKSNCVYAVNAVLCIVGLVADIVSVKFSTITAVIIVLVLLLAFVDIACAVAERKKETSI